MSETDPRNGTAYFLIEAEADAIFEYTVRGPRLDRRPQEAAGRPTIEVPPRQLAGVPPMPPPWTEAHILILAGPLLGRHDTADHHGGDEGEGRQHRRVRLRDCYRRHRHDRDGRGRENVARGRREAD